MEPSGPHPPSDRSDGVSVPSAVTSAGGGTHGTVNTRKRTRRADEPDRRGSQWSASAHCGLTRIRRVLAIRLFRLVQLQPGAPSAFSRPSGNIALAFACHLTAASKSPASARAAATCRARPAPSTWSARRRGPTPRPPACRRGTSRPGTSPDPSAAVERVGGFRGRAAGVVQVGHRLVVRLLLVPDHPAIRVRPGVARVEPDRTIEVTIARSKSCFSNHARPRLQ